MTRAYLLPYDDRYHFIRVFHLGSQMAQGILDYFPPKKGDFVRVSHVRCQLASLNVVITVNGFTLFF